jgi:hypothetical protein
MSATIPTLLSLAVTPYHRIPHRKLETRSVPRLGINPGGRPGRWPGQV